jgi:cytochrome c556
MLKLVKGVVATAIVLSLSGGVAVVAQAQSDVIKARQENRKALTGVGRELKRLIDANADAAQIVEQTNKAVELNKAFAGMFPPGSDKGGDTLAAPSIWTDRAGFDAADKASNDAFLKLAELAKAGDRAGVNAQYGVAGRSCGECHRNYTTSDPFKKK